MLAVVRDRGSSCDWAAAAEGVQGERTADGSHEGFWGHTCEEGTERGEAGGDDSEGGLGGSPDDE